MEFWYLTKLDLILAIAAVFRVERYKSKRYNKILLPLKSCWWVYWDFSISSIPFVSELRLWEINVEIWAGAKVDNYQQLAHYMFWGFKCNEYLPCLQAKWRPKRREELTSKYAGIQHPDRRLRENSTWKWKVNKKANWVFCQLQLPLGSFSFIILTNFVLTKMDYEETPRKKFVNYCKMSSQMVG